MAHRDPGSHDDVEVAQRPVARTPVRRRGPAAAARGWSATALLADRGTRAIVVTLGDARGTPMSAGAIVAASHVDATPRLIRDRLRELERAGILVVDDAAPVDYDPGMHWALTASGHDLYRLLSLMSRVVVNAAGFDDAVASTVRDRAVEETLIALSDPIAVRIIGSLAGEDHLDPVALERHVAPTPRRTLYRRLDLLVGGGVVVRETTRGVPRRTRYALSDRWRPAAVLLLLSAWWEGRHLALTGKAAVIDIEGPLRVVLPNVRAARVRAGAHVRWVVRQGEDTERLVLTARGGRLSVVSSADEPVDAELSGPPEAWTAGLIADQRDGLQVSGDAKVAFDLFDDVRAALLAYVR